MINVKKFNSLFELMEAFPTEESCIRYLESLRWKEGVTSPFDPDSKVYICSKGRYMCKNTGKLFNVKTGTLFENTKLSLRKWFMAIWLILSNKKGISSLQLSRDIKVTQKPKKDKTQAIRFAVPSSQMKKKAITLGMSEEIFCELFSKQKIGDCFIGAEDAAKNTRKIFHPTKEEEKRDHEYCEELREKGVDFDRLQEGLSFVPPFKEFLGVGSSSK